MIVCIAEKPSVARDIARIIGATAKHEGFIEGNGYQVTWTFGHLCELKEPGEYAAEWKNWRLDYLPMIPPRFGIKVKDEEGVKKQFAVIEKLMQAADGIINCGDAGQEGELIQRWVMQKAGATCPVKRLWISSMTDEAIREGFQNLKDQADYHKLYIAGLSRAIGDWLLGINCTRLYSIRYGQPGHPLSVGRVQTPTLALIVRRQQEIENFKPEPYWVLSTVYRETTFTATKGKFLKKEEGEAAFATIEGKPFTVTKVEKKEGKEQPPQLYDLTSLQVDCNRKYGYSAEQTLNLIQSLYEKKYTTYPRVDTQYLSDDIYPKCPPTLNGLYQTKFNGVAPYAELIRPIGGKALRKTKRVFDTTKVTDHHAIIPTGQIPTALSDMERNVFDLVARRFIAVFHPDCTFSTTTVMGKVDDVEFKVTGKEILNPGWRVVYPKTTANQTENADENKDEERTLPTFTVGETGPHTPTLTEKMTQPPSYYTEATLLRAMETAGKLVDNEELRAALKENGIGRPSTRAAIIETLFKRHYIRKDRKRLLATPTGVELIGLIREELLKSAELTGIWEKKLREIERGQYDAQQFLEELKQMVTEIVNAVRSDTTNRRVTVVEEPQKKPKKATAGQRVAGFQPRSTKRKEASPSSHSEKEQGGEADWVGLPCPKCHEGHIIKGHAAYGCSRWKEGCDWRHPFS
ncbi:MAG: DNA topoisomerase 3 [Bacteroidaceae bacterium]|nr:DNA topoisomerase 3 [Bacteroidaceae bacterium]